MPMTIFGRMFGRKSADAKPDRATASHDPEEVRALMRRGTELFQAGNWAEAEAAL